MTDVSLDFEVSIDAPVHTVFEYCRDPRRIYAGDPTHEVSDATVVPEGVGTRAQIVAKVAVVVEHDAPRWERVVDALTARTPTKAFSKEIRDRLARIRARTEEQAASAA
jgi:hypothetical protein